MNITGPAIRIPPSGGKPFSPIDIGAGSLVLWLRGDLGVTLGSTMRATGTAPPAVSISGALTPAVGLHIEIDSVAGGTGLGQATFKWSINNGTSYVATGVATGAAVVLGTTGITAAFAAGPYNIDNKWDCTVSAWADQSGNANHVTEASAAFQPQFLLNGINGLPALNYDGGTRRLRTGAASTTLTSHSMFEVVKLNSAGAFTLFTHVTGADNRWVYTGVADSLRTQVGGVTSGKNASAGSGWVSTAAQSVGCTYNGTHATNLAWKNMVAVPTTDTTINDPGVGVSAGQMVIGTNAGVSATVNGLIAEFVAYNSVLSAADMTRLQDYFHNAWAI